MVGKPFGLPHSYFSLKSICVNLLGTPQPSWLIQAERRRLFQNHLHQSCARPATPRSNQGPLIQFDLSLKVSESLCKLFGAEITWRFFRSHWGTPKSSKSLNYFSIETLLVTCVSPWFHKVPLEDKPNNIPTTTSCWVSMWLFSHTCHQVAEYVDAKDSPLWWKSLKFRGSTTHMLSTEVTFIEMWICMDHLGFSPRLPVRSSHGSSQSCCTRYALTQYLRVVN